MSLQRTFVLALALGAFAVAVPSAHASIGDMSGITGTPNDGGIDPPNPPGGGGGDPILDGCTNSPENSTAILAALGTIGIGVGMRIRPLIAKRRQSL